MIHNEGRGGGGEPAHAEPPRARNSHCCGHRHSLAQHRSYHQCFQGICYRLSAMNTEQLKARPSEFKQFAKKTLFPKGPPPLHWLRLGLCWSKARNSNVSQGKVAKTLTGGKMLEEPPLPESATVHIFQPGSRSTSTVANLDTLKVFDFPKERKFTFVGPTGS